VRHIHTNQIGHWMGYNSRRPHRVPLISTTNRKKRLQFASAHQNWFLEHDNEFTVLKWPPQSPDLNPKEHLWDLVEREFHGLDVHPTNLNQLQDAIL